MHTLTTLRALAKRCGRGSNPDDVETYARADLLKLFQERTEIARLFGETEERVSKALEKVEADGKLDDLGFMTIDTIKSRLEKAKKEKGDASIVRTEIAARVFLKTPSLATLRALCDAGDFGAKGCPFDRSKIAKILKTINDADVSVGRGLTLTRYTRTRFAKHSGKEIRADYDRREIDPSTVGEKHEKVRVNVPQFSIQVKGDRFEYTFCPSTSKGSGFDLTSV